MQQNMPSDFAGTPGNSGEEIVREVVGLFDNAKDLRAAINELDSNFPRHAISVLGKRDAVVREFGEPAVAPEAAVENNDTPRAAPLRQEEKMIGESALIGSGVFIGISAATILAGAAVAPMLPAALLGAGVGGLITAGITALMEGHWGRHVDDQVDKGGLILWVQAADMEREALATDVMKRHGGHDVRAQDKPEN